MMKIEQLAMTKAEMLVRKPVAQILESFIDLAIASRFWCTKNSGRLEMGDQVR